MTSTKGEPTMKVSTMKAPAPDTQNIRIIFVFKRIVLLPFTAIAALWAVICRWAQWCKSPTERRAADQLRQSRVRRELRGLPPDHDEAVRKPG
jgi:hypothetical protein